MASVPIERAPGAVLAEKQKTSVARGHPQLGNCKHFSQESDQFSADAAYPSPPRPVFVSEEILSSVGSPQPSQTVSSRSSWDQVSVTTPATTTIPASIVGHESKPQHELVAPVPRLPVSIPNRNSGDSSLYSESEGRASTEIQPAAAPREDPAPQVPLANSTPPRVEVDTEKQTEAETLISRGKRKVKFQKWTLAACLVAVNTIFIFASWYWPKYYYIYLPFISFPLVLNCVMIASIIVFTLLHAARPEKQVPLGRPENLVYVIPCYNETYEECTRSLDSLVNQTGLDEHKKGIMVICDGRVRGPGMAKTTGDYLNEDIFLHQTQRRKIQGAYTAWDGQQMDIEISRGTYKGVPFYCIVKDQNQGKRDSLIVIRSFLYKFNKRRENPTHIYSREFLDSMTDWLENDVKVESVDHLIGMDADTVFEDKCVTELLKESYYPNTVGVCGYVAVDYKDSNWNLWSIYQSAEYTIAQGLRRLHQSIATKKVSCLPGCCQLLRICEETCGDLVLVDLFGYHPQPLDGMLKRIRATASEDRNHICQLLITFPLAQTRQALHARAYTDVPHSWNVFLSQRRRWTLGATSNDLLLFTARRTQWFERIVAFSNVLTWCLNVFVIASIGVMIIAFITQPWWLIVAFAGVMIIPLCYYIIMSIWLPRNMLERFQFLLGLAIFVVGGPFLNIAVMLYAVFNMDNFGWGKTRKVLKEDPAEKPKELEQSSEEEKQQHTPVGSERYAVAQA